MAGARISKFKLEMNSDGFKTLIQSAPVLDMVGEKTADIANRAGEGFNHETAIKKRHGVERPTGMVWAATREARKAEAENKVLTRAVGG